MFVFGLGVHLTKLTSIPALFLESCQGADSFSWHHKKNGKWVSYSKEELLLYLKKFYLAFKSIGVKKGENIGIIASNSPLWILSDLAIQICGAVTVPLFPNIAEENFLFEKKDANIDILILESTKILDQDLTQHLSNFKKILFLEKEDFPLENSIFLEDVFKDSVSKINLSSFHEEFKQLIKEIPENSLFSIIYTSGSTGFPKGAELSHRNMLSQFSSLAKILKLDSEDSALSILPLAHIFERMTIYFLIYSKTSIYFGDNAKQLATLFKEAKPSLITVVPRLLERVYEKVIKLSNTPIFIKRIWVKRAIRWAQTHDPQKKSGFLGHFYDFLVLKKIRHIFGGNIKYVISGSSALNKNICRFFLNIGVPVYEGYGMTECAPVISVNAEEKARPGSVGLPLEHLNVKISTDGEILVRGESVFKGYHNLKDKNKDFFTEDGFFRTGDSGYFGNGGLLYLTGRIKEMMKTSTGKYVSPTPIEEDLIRLPLISSACIIANNRKYVSALLFLQSETAADFLQIPSELFQAHKAVSSKRISAAIEKHIKNVNKHLNHWEQIRQWVLLPDSLTAENGLLTPTMKIRRREIEKIFSETIDSLYKSDSQ